MRTPIILAIAAIACLTVTYGFVKSSNIAFDNVGHGDQVESAFRTAWAAGKQDEDSRVKLAWLCCETRRYADARKIFAELHAARKLEPGYSAAYSNDFAMMAQVEIADTKFDEALRQYQAKLAYDQRFFPSGAPEIANDHNSMAVAEALLAQTKANIETQSDAVLTDAEGDLQAADSRETDAAHNLMVKENRLVVAQERGQSDAIHSARRDVEAARARLKIAVPIQQF